MLQKYVILISAIIILTSCVQKKDSSLNEESAKSPFIQSGVVLSATVNGSELVKQSDKYVWKMVDDFQVQKGVTAYILVPENATYNTLLSRWEIPSATSTGVLDYGTITLSTSEMDISACKNDLKISKDKSWIYLCSSEEQLKGLMDYWNSFDNGLYSEKILKDGKYSKLVWDGQNYIGSKQIDGNKFLRMSYSPQYQGNMNIVFTYEEYMGSGKLITYKTDLGPRYYREMLDSIPVGYYESLNKQFLDWKFDDIRVQNVYVEILENIKNIHTITKF